MTTIRRLSLLALVLAASVAGVPFPARAQENLPAGEAASAAAKPEPYIRIVSDDEGVLHLELAVRTFTPARGEGPTVRLVSAVHIADASFYEEVQERLDAHDLVLYEGVRPEGTGRLPDTATEEERVEATRRRLEILQVLADRQRGKDGAYPADLDALTGGLDPRWRPLLPTVLVDGWGRPIRYRACAASPEPGGPKATLVVASDGPDGRPDAEGAEGDDLVLEVEAETRSGRGHDWDLYARVAAALGLVPQHEGVDTSGPNWRCSDMGLDELHDRVKAEGGDLTVLLGFLEGSSLFGRLAGFAMLILSRSPRMAAMMKIGMVEGLASDIDVTEDDAFFLGRNPAAVMRVILEDRNAVVVEDLRKVLAEEKTLGTIAVFYGAAHMPDMERRFAKDLGYRPGGTAWISAIRVDPREAGLTPKRAEQLRRRLGALPKGKSE